jgi:DNA-binding response OmpR family regulator
VTTSGTIKHQANRWPARGPARVLLVLDRPTLVELIKLTLNHGVYTIRAVATPSEVETSVPEWHPHLLVLDMDLDGAQILARLGAHSAGGVRLPVLGLTRRGDLKTKLGAFEADVDDILTIPFAPEELLARVIAVLRRSYSDAVTFTPVIKLGELEIDILNRTVRAGSSELHLTSLEQSLLYLLAANAGRVVTRKEILDRHRQLNNVLGRDGRGGRRTEGAAGSAPSASGALGQPYRPAPGAEPRDHERPSHRGRGVVAPDAAAVAHCPERPEEPLGLGR